jgi:hypothetical protein
MGSMLTTVSKTIVNDECSWSRGLFNGQHNTIFVNFEKGTISQKITEFDGFHSESMPNEVQPISSPKRESYLKKRKKIARLREPLPISIFFETVERAPAADVPFGLPHPPPLRHRPKTGALVRQWTTATGAPRRSRRRRGWTRGTSSTAPTTSSTTSTTMPFSSLASYVLSWSPPLSPPRSCLTSPHSPLAGWLTYPFPFAFVQWSHHRGGPWRRQGGPEGRGAR